jgi:hypothetical protein
VELQQVLPKLEAAGIALFAVSYDPVTTLEAFSDKHGIAYPLLSDDGSHVMRRLGLINERVQEDHAVYGIKPDPRHTNLPYPGVFALDASGVIVGKRFHESYRERDAGVTLLAHTLGLRDPAPEAATGSPDDPVRVAAWLASPTYSFFQRLDLNVEIHLAPGFRVCTPPAPDGIVPLTVRVMEVPGVETGPIEWPAGAMGRVPGVERLAPVHAGSLRGVLPLTFAAPPGAGDHTLRVAVTYQAFSESVRLPPSSVEAALAIKEVAMVDRTLPPRPHA